MGRHFTGASGDYLDFAPGGLAALDGGPSTIVVLWRPTTVHAGWLLHTDNGSGSQTLALNPYSDGATYHTVGATYHATQTYTSLDGWRLDLWTKPDGAGQVRSHSLLLSGGGWVHTDRGSSPDAPGSLPITRFRIGKHYTTSGALDADLAAFAVVGANWLDAQIEAGNLPTGLSAWESVIGSDPGVLLGFGQAAVTDPVNDLTGGGADQTGRSGTTLAPDPPGFSYLLGSVGALAGVLPALTGALVGVDVDTATLAGTLPALTGAMVGTPAVAGVLAGTLPALTGAFAQSVSTSTPQVTATLTQRPLAGTITTT